MPYSALSVYKAGSAITQSIAYIHSQTLQSKRQLKRRSAHYLALAHLGFNEVYIGLYLKDNVIFDFF